MKIYTFTDTKFIYFAIWNDEDAMGGYWSGLVGYNQPLRKINLQKINLHGGTEEVLAENLKYLESLCDPKIYLYKFSAIQHGDYNVGPENSYKYGFTSSPLSSDDEDIIWKKEVVFDHLINTVKYL
jgi:hypothetical protein